MGNVSYSAHISNGKSAITSKKALAGVAKHNLRKYKSADYSSDNIRLIYGTTDLFQDVKRVYHREFDDVVKEYNSRQKREDRKIKDYFEHVAGLNQDMAVEIIFQCGDKKYWDEHWKNKNYMSEVFDYILECLQKLLPEFKIANAVIHFDEASPHMHVVGIPVWEGAKRGLSKKVSKRNVFTPQTLSVILQDKLRAEASYGFECYFKEQLAEKKKGRNHDLSVTEYKVAQESRKLTDIKQQNNEEQEKNTKLRSNNASISYQIATQEQRHSRNLDVIAADEDRLETVRSSINAAETEYAKYADMIMDKKNNLELLSSKESELIERTKIAESVFDMFRQSGTDDVREKLIDKLDFGKEWFDMPCSDAYWDAVQPIFDMLKNEKDNGSRWSEINDKDEVVYVPLLHAFMDEVNRAYKEDKNMPRKMIEYLIGIEDYYKVVSRDSKRLTMIHTFNMHDTLNKPSENKVSAITVPVVELPTRLVALEFKPGSTNTVEMFLDNGWQLSFRIHNASTKVEPSLKFDVQFIGMPTSVLNIECKWK